MRDPKRIAVMCRALEEVWLLYPDMRLGQLIVNITGSDPWHFEDGEILERMLRVMRTGEFTQE